MVKRCALCGIVDNIIDVSVHKFPSAAHRRLDWVAFVVDQGFPVNQSSKLCSRHFVPGIDYAVGNAERRRLSTTAVPSLVVGRQLVPGVAEEPEDHMQVEIEVVDENAMMDDHIIEVVMEDGVMHEDNVEIVVVENMEVQMDDEVLPADVEIVDVLPGELEFMDIIDDFNPEVAVELPRVHAPQVDRPAGVQHPLPDRHDIGPLNQVCRHCEARHFNCERASRGHFTLCCNNNQMVIAEGPRRLQQAPELLQSLLVDDSQIATQYRRDIRRYNNTLAFAAFSTDLNQRRLPGRGPRVFTVHGQVYRRITNDVVRNDDRHPSYCELYFIESGEANRTRMNQNHQGELNETVLTDLDTMLRQTNPFAMAFSNMRAVWLEEQRIANANPLVQPRRVTMHLVADPNSDPRRYNLPPAQVNEVSVVFAGNNGQPPRNLDLVVFDSNPVNPQHRMQNLSYGSQHADPMLYPLLFPHGELGWHFELRQEDGGRRNAVRTRNTIREFVCHRLAIRYEGTKEGVLSTILYWDCIYVCYTMLLWNFLNLLCTV